MKEGSGTSSPDGVPSLPENLEKNDQPVIPDILPILPIRDMVVFPGTVVPLTIRRDASLKLLDTSLPESKIIGLIAQRDGAKDDPAPDDLYGVGTAVTVLKLLRQPDETVLIIAQALQRIAADRFILTHPFLKAEVRVLESSSPPESKQWEAEIKNLRENAMRIIELSPDIPDQARAVLLNITDGGQLADFLATNLNVDTAQKQALLEEIDVTKRVKAVQTHIAAQLEIVQIQQKLQKDLASQFSEAQRKTYLREQMKAIQRELGEGDTGGETVQLRTRLEAAHPPAEVMAQAERELKRLDLIPPASPEFSVIVSYIETLADLPWQKMSEDNLDLNEARRILDRDHYGLEKVKRRLIEYLAVRKLNPEGRGPILCFLGPPGVGKTSLGQSIADALGRKFSRMSLGGIRDEAEIRGHRRTYIGSMPGRLIQELRRAGTR
ncbi:MAG TPA: LON peptidase substrate-binding domain-containing protein, partial [Terrimicrobiaceae bacterium]|nr:LON peptidase substrate-binding domain-containing protein [Terrimicrobiaceae bacterium]